MIVELLFVKIVFLQLWYAYICFKSYNDQQRWVSVKIVAKLTKHYTVWSLIRSDIL